MSRQVLMDKIRGGWAGQMIGVSFGAPTEFASNGKINDGAIAWSPEHVSNALIQDDLYVEMTFTEVMDRIGLDATSEQYGDAFKNSRYELWHANAAARRLLNAGIKAPWSGHPQYNIHANDIDFQIESDFIGLMTPGLPREANKYADRVGHVMTYGDGVYGGMFFAGMYAAAFFEHDPRRVVEAGLRSIPAQSGYAKVIHDVLAWSAEHPDDWKKTWRLLEDKWDKDDPCPDGALSDFTIDARLNGAYVALALVYGHGDFATTIEIATRSGQDSDCNPSSAGGILGVMIGYAAIPDRWKSGLAAIADSTFDYTSYSFNTIIASTLQRALRVIQLAGGTVTDAGVIIPRQEPTAWKLEQWNPGRPARLIGIEDTAWTWSDAWTTETSNPDEGKVAVRVASGAGAEVSLRFTGVAIALVGPLSQSGGRADVYVDGRKTRPLDAFIPERTHDNALWHAYDLAPGAHTVRIVLRDDADARAKGKRVVIERAISYASARAARDLQ
jgi:ADP-ribosylglycohydrolase